jgi:hypothetical protein
MAEALAPLLARTPRTPRSHEVLRVAADLAAADDAALAEARRRVLAWAGPRAGAPLPEDAHRGLPFELLTGGRTTLAERLDGDGVELWALSADDPDREVPGRVWTTEVLLARTAGRARFGLRLLVATAEDRPAYVPAVPRLVGDLAEQPGLREDGRALGPRPFTVADDGAAAALVALLESPSRQLPVIVLSGDQRADDPAAPLLDAASLARRTIGLAHVAVVAGPQTFALSDAFGKMLSVYYGAVRLYWPGFDAAADPYAHPLFLDRKVREMGEALAEELRRRVAATSLQRLRLEADIPSFATVRAAARRAEAAKRAAAGAAATDADVAARLAEAERRTTALEAALAAAEAERDDAFALAAEEEERARAAEAQAAALADRLDALERRLRDRGEGPDADLSLPAEWSGFADWCDQNLAGRLVLAPAARRGVRAPLFADPALAARCLIWLAGPCRSTRIGGGMVLDSASVADGMTNTPCGADAFDFTFRGRRLTADWHIKNRSNTRDPARCLRIYYTFDPATRLVVVAEMPAHRRTGAS